MRWELGRANSERLIGEEKVGTQIVEVKITLVLKVPTN